MAKHNFLFFNLGEEDAARISQTIANKTAQRILDELKRGNATETEIAKRLSLPLSTVHYNMQQLVDAHLVIGDQYHYSAKGREVSHYRLTNKVIVIAPSGTTQFEQLARTLIPAALIVAAGTWFVSFISSRISNISNSNFFGDMAPYAAKSVASAAMIVNEGIATTSAGAPAPSALMMNADLANTTDTVARAVSVQPNYALWFLVGGVVILGVSLLIMWMWNRRK